MSIATFRDRPGSTLPNPMPGFAKDYENNFARSVGADHAIAFGFARHALVSILTAAGLRGGDEVVLSPLTCKVVPLALLSLGLRPVYTDISETTLNLDPISVRDRIGPATRAILFQHTYGHAGGIEEITALARRHELLVVEDCAQCMPIIEDGYRPGHHGSYAIFSNNPGKPLPAGSGGMAVARDAVSAGAIRALRDRLPRRQLRAEIILYAMTGLHRHVLRPSLYWPLFDLYRRATGSSVIGSLEKEIANEVTACAVRASLWQARLGMQWIPKIPALAQHRRDCCAAYAEGLGDMGNIIQPVDAGTTPLYFYPILVENKAELLHHARRSRTEIIPWPIVAPIYPLEHISAMSTFGYRPGDCPTAESVATRLVGLPTHEKVTAKVRDKVVALLRSR